MKVNESIKVRDKMTGDLVTVDSTATARDAAKKMESENVGTVLVFDKGMLKGLVRLTTFFRLITFHDGCSFFWPLRTIHEPYAISEPFPSAL